MGVQKGAKAPGRCKRHPTFIGGSAARPLTPLRLALSVRWPSVLITAPAHTVRPQTRALSASGCSSPPANALGLPVRGRCPATELQWQLSQPLCNLLRRWARRSRVVRSWWACNEGLRRPTPPWEPRKRLARIQWALPRPRGAECSCAAAALPQAPPLLQRPLPGRMRWHRMCSSRQHQVRCALMVQQGL